MCRRAALVVALLGGVPAVARAGDPPPVDLTDRHADEARALLPLLRQAVREHQARQAWYLAWRILAADPTNAEAQKYFAAHEPESFASDDAPEPSKAFVVARDRALAAEGLAYVRSVRDYLKKGVDPDALFSLAERAFAYGSRDKDFVASMADAGWSWAGTWGFVRTPTLEASLRGLAGAVTFPPEWDDAYLAVRPTWQGARILALASWRLVTEEGLLAAARRATLLLAVEAQVAAILGAPAGARREGAAPTDVLVVPDAALFDAFGKRWAPRDAADRLARSSGLESMAGRRILVLAKDRLNPWAGEDSPCLFHVARNAAGARVGWAGARMTGRGAWLLDGLAGCFEGFVAKGATGGDLVAARCWRLHAAKALRARRALLPWDALLEVDAAAQGSHGRVDVTVRFRGADRNALGVDVVAAQGTALVWGMLHADGGKDARRLATAFAEALARGRLPDLDWAMGWEPGRVVREAEKALDALPDGD